MTLVMGYIKDLDIAVPLIREVRFKDPRTEKPFDGWIIDVAHVEEAFWPKLLADMRTRFKDAPPDDEAFKAEILKQGGLPIRAERVQVHERIRVLEAELGADWEDAKKMADDWKARAEKAEAQWKIAADLNYERFATIEKLTARIRELEAVRGIEEHLLEKAGLRDDVLNALSAVLGKPLGPNPAAPAPPCRHVPLHLNGCPPARTRKRRPTARARSVPFQAKITKEAKT
jgi:hypothetical protein